MRKGKIMVPWYCLFKRAEETCGHILVWCPISMVYDIWNSGVQLGNDWDYKGCDLGMEGYCWLEKTFEDHSSCKLLGSVERKK